MEARLVKDESVTSSSVFTQDPLYINGLPTHTLEISSHISIDQSNMCQLINTNGGSGEEETQEIGFIEFSPGSIIVFE